MGISFALKDTKSTIQTPINLHVSHKGTRVKVSTGQKIEPSNWNGAKHRVREKAGVHYREINRILEQQENTMKLVLFEVDGGQLQPEHILNRFNEMMGKSTRVELSFPEWFESVVESIKTTNSYDSARPFVNALGRFNDFQQSEYTVNWNTLGLRFYFDFVEFLTSKKYSANTIGSIVNRVKNAITRAHKKGLISDDRIQEMKLAEWKVQKEDVYNVYLTNEELKRLMQLKKLTETEEAARDMFLIGCYTGMRVGNYLHIDNDVNIDTKENVIRVIVNKNGPRVTIPIHPVVGKILKRWDGMPPSISEQKLRDKIKQLCTLAKIDQVVEWSRTEGGRRVVYRQKKFEMVSTHTARRTFATNAYKAGLPIPAIMKITGHTSIKTFMHYIKITDEENAEILANSAFFS